MVAATTNTAETDLETMKNSVQKLECSISLLHG